jgi:hypothetical protein
MGSVSRRTPPQPAGTSDAVKQEKVYVESLAVALARALLRAYQPAVVAGVGAGIVLGVLVGWAVAASVPMAGLALLAGIVAGLAVAVAVATSVLLVGIGAWVYLDIVRNVVPNGFGLCRGNGKSRNGEDRITPWLHRLIQEAAGRTVDDDPLTFGDLWHVGGVPDHLRPPPAHGDHRSINLVMFTTNLSHGRPDTFPHTDEHARLFYQPAALKEYLPCKVMEWMDKRAGQYEPKSPQDPTVARMEELKLRPVPDAEDLPVLLAARMSLSYPVLFSAVPLWAIDYEKPGQRDFAMCWFSDGGIASNFPIHLFDGFLPAWPTFGIDLETLLPGSKEVDLPEEPDRGVADRWNRFNDEPAASTQFAGFLLAVISTMQNWNDNMNARMPGVRDRIARVRLREYEGGFNLDMPADCQENVARLGSEAASRLIARFVGNGSPSKGWDVQRWDRLQVLVRTLEKRLPGVEVALRDGLPETTTYNKLAAKPGLRIAGDDDVLQPAQRKTLSSLLWLIGNAAKTLGPTASQLKTRPIPDPELRVRPPI